MYEALVWENVDLQERTATTPKTKNGEQVVVQLNDDAILPFAYSVREVTEQAESYATSGANH